MRMLKSIGGFIFLLITSNLYGQVDRGSLSGTVRDSSGSVVSRATVSAVQDATGLKHDAVFSGSGTYNVPELRVGIYTVAFAVKGFESVKFESVQVALEHTATLNTVLKVSSAPAERSCRWVTG